MPAAQNADVVDRRGLGESDDWGPDIAAAWPITNSRKHFGSAARLAVALCTASDAPGHGADSRHRRTPAGFHRKRAKCGHIGD